MKWLLIVLSVIIVLIIIGGASQILASSAPVSAMSGTNCLGKGCHEPQNGDAQIYVGLNGRDATGNPELAVTAGDTFEIDFHFSGMLGKESRYKGVGALIVMPEQAKWKVSAGTDSHPSMWSAKGVGDFLWSPKWDRAANGGGATTARWLATSDQPTAYYLDFSASDWVVKPHLSVAADAGPADLDGVADHMGADALIEVPFEAPAGIYKIMVSGIGNGKDGRPSRVSKLISVEVHAASKPTPPPAEVPSGRLLYLRNCSGCHGQVPRAETAKTPPAEILKVMTEGRGQMKPQLDEKGGRLTAKQAADIIGYLRAEAIAGPAAAAPKIAHMVSGREECLSCHAMSGGMKPAPANHQGYLNDACRTCHQSPPPMAHPPQGDSPCSSCHMGNGPLQLASTHDGRTDATCYKCHEGAPKPKSDATTGSGGTATKPPAIPHSLEGREACLSCHAAAGMISVPDSHRTYQNNMCTGCHVR